MVEEEEGGRGRKEIKREETQTSVATLNRNLIK